MTKRKYYIVEENALPPIIAKVVLVQQLLQDNPELTISKAVSQVGISRSVYYKYQNKVQPFSQQEPHQTVTLSMNLIDHPGVLSDVLKVLALFHLNLLTINQSIPINGLAYITVTLEILQNSTKDLDSVILQLQNHPKIKTVAILARG